MKNNRSEKSGWIKVESAFNEKTLEALLIQHQAVQYISLVGKYFIAEKADDSHTNMQFVNESDSFIGNDFGDHFKIAFNTRALKLLLINDRNEIKSEIELVGKTKEEVFSALQQLLEENGFNSSQLKNKWHYSIPEHPLDHGGKFESVEKKHSQINYNYRHNATIVLNEIADKFGFQTDIRVWPHHFDTGAFIPMSYNKDGALNQYIGLGFAIPDTMINEPYFYLSFWSEETIIALKNPKSIQNGKWMIPDWNGAVLKISDILNEKTAVKQHQMVYDFFVSGLDALLPFMKQD